MKDDVTVTTTVRVPPERAFRVFTEEVDRWWGRGPRYRFLRGQTGVLRFEPGVGGRLIEDAGDDRWEVGEVLVWEPGARLVFRWRLRNFAADEATEVELTFEPLGDGTKVVLRHRGLAALRPDHPARHGLQGPAYPASVGQSWGRLLVSFRELALAV